MGEVMKEYNAVFSVALSDGFANISFNDKNEMVVEFLGDEGSPYTDGMELPLQDIDKVSKFMGELKVLRLEEFAK